MSVPSTLVLNGSPRADGNSATLAGELLRRLGGAGPRVDLYRLRIAPCVDCGWCATAGECPIADDVPGVLDLLAEADVTVIASPLHFSSLTAPVIALFSRLQPFWKGGRTLPPRRRAGVVALTAGGLYNNMFAPARSVAAAAFNTVRIPFAGVLSAAETDAIPLRDNAPALADAEAMATRVRTMLDEGNGRRP